MTKKKSSNASTATAETKVHTISVGVTVGRVAERLLVLEAEEREALLRSPEAIKLGFQKKRDELLGKLTEVQRLGAVAMANAMRPTPVATENAIDPGEAAAE
jgi:hypothetical protein